jgi:hypothetical protein
MFWHATFVDINPLPQALACEVAWLYSVFSFFPAKTSSTDTAEVAISIAATAATGQSFYDVVSSSSKDADTNNDDDDDDNRHDDDTDANGDSQDQTISQGI